MSGPSLVPVAIPEDPEEHERIHVHEVYDEIAPHFASTRYKPWPIIAQFLNSLPPGSVGLDSGTGNGKYLPLGNSIWTIGLDKSRRLLEIAQGAGGQRREVVWGDALDLGWRKGAFDYAISIATLHHLATPARRQKAIETLLQLISPAHGRLLIYVWAVEQDHLSRRVLPSPTSPAQGQDVFVPWVMHGPASSSSPQVFNRYYHMFVAGELEELAREAVTALGLICGPHQQGQQGVEIVQSGWERSNWYIEMKRWNV